MPVTKVLKQNVTLWMGFQQKDSLIANGMVKLLSTDNTIVEQADGANDDVIGVVTSPDADGKEISVAMEGIVPIACAATITPGTAIVTDSAGKAIAIRTAAPGTEEKVIGIALTNAASGELLMVHLGRFRHWQKNTT